MTLHGRPFWYELSTAKGALPDAQKFYEDVIGWNINDSGMPDFNYLLATGDSDAMISGLSEMPDDVSDMPPFWMIYFAVDDADAAAEKIRELGGSVFREPQDIPDTGRFLIAADPQGAAFGLLQPLPMEEGQEFAFDQSKDKHANWNELMTPDPDAAFDFYNALLGWEKSTPVDMGDEGIYQLFKYDGKDAGAIMPLLNAPVPNWLPYFGANGVTEAISRLETAKGTLVHGPVEVPGGAHIAVMHDPQGAYFAVVGPLNHTAS